MSSMNRAGYNFFFNVPVCVTCDEVSDLLLHRGYNDFSGYQQFVFAGSLDTLCSLEEACDMLLDANYNHWGGGLGANVLINDDALWYPSESMFDLYATETTACNAYEYGTQCRITYQDISPIRIKDCPTGMPVAERSSIVNTEQIPIRCSVRSFAGQLIITAQEAIHSCSLYDLLGRKIDCFVSGQMSDGDVQLNMSELDASGYYVLVVETASGRSVHRNFHD